MTEATTDRTKILLARQAERGVFYVDPELGDDRNVCDCPIPSLCEGRRVSCRIRTFAEMLRRIEHLNGEASRTRISRVEVGDPSRDDLHCRACGRCLEPERCGHGRIG